MASSCPGLEGLTLEPAHLRPELLDACADLINQEWPRSRASRLHSLGQSSDSFPLCLALLGPPPIPGALPTVLGHSRLSRVAAHDHSLLVETVVVARALRGQGFGRRLMEATEAFARARGFRRLHLTTHDKQHFYAHLGYQLGEPVQGVAFSSPLAAAVLQAFSQPTSPPEPKPPRLCRETARIPSTPSATDRPPGPKLPPVPPPPPPLPAPLLSPPAVSPTGPLQQSLVETPYRDIRGRPIFWMTKEI
ncbi:N-alpha-acetyltransferase 80 [Dromiciops gliroides]|uniref:N-alpha-acetyltransferase 80 n=1 Tax=Dromiciops gliroides TaxID=33562 RepID=UPI001CC48591|nr:N-alpha-acetyltransferase 80 [Dromiciops gliroides]XP_043833497.1 N-alpha-acetyltransferase 80 [Dromiciops gliroides]XP_043833499.1 N-alpha-acetyltransferase 80 [Dromiciops gliroides]